MITAHRACSRLPKNLRRSDARETLQGRSTRGNNSAATLTHMTVAGSASILTPRRGPFITKHPFGLGETSTC